MKVGVAIADITTGMLAATGTLAALLEARADGPRPPRRDVAPRRAARVARQPRLGGASIGGVEPAALRQRAPVDLPLRDLPGPRRLREPRGGHGRAVPALLRAGGARRRRAPTRATPRNRDRVAHREELVPRLQAAFAHARRRRLAGGARGRRHPVRPGAHDPAGPRGRAVRARRARARDRGRIRTIRSPLALDGDVPHGRGRAAAARASTRGRCWRSSATTRRRSRASWRGRASRRPCRDHAAGRHGAARARRRARSSRRSWPTTARRPSRLLGATVPESWPEAELRSALPVHLERLRLGGERRQLGRAGDRGGRRAASAAPASRAARGRTARSRSATASCPRRAATASRRWRSRRWSSGRCASAACAACAPPSRRPTRRRRRSRGAPGLRHVGEMADREHGVLEVWELGWLRQRMRRVEALAHAGPLLRHDRVVDRVAEGAVVEHHVAAVDALLDRAEPLDRPSRGLVERARLERDALGLELVERVAGAAGASSPCWRPCAGGRGRSTSSRSRAARRCTEMLP